MYVSEDNDDRVQIGKLCQCYMRNLYLGLQRVALGISAGGKEKGEEFKEYNARRIS